MTPDRMRRSKADQANEAAALFFADLVDPHREERDEASKNLLDSLSEGDRETFFEHLDSLTPEQEMAATFRYAQLASERKIGHDDIQGGLACFIEALQDLDSNKQGSSPWGAGPDA